MFPSLQRYLPRLGRKWKPLNFSNPNFVWIPESHKIEEETVPDYVPSHYYPTRIGEIIKERYQIVGKLGFGTTSTAWLARDMDARRHVALKIFTDSTSMGQQLDDELSMYKRMEKSSKRCQGHHYVRTLLDSFEIDRASTRHLCLVHPPLWESVWAFLHRNPIGRLPPPVLAGVLRSLFLALDYLHTECKIIHTDISAGNIMIGIEDDSVFGEFEEREIQDPGPRKVVDSDGRTIYLSQDLRIPKQIGHPVLCDFGSAVPGDMEHLEDIQPNHYRAPEVILGVPWTYSVDIWNVGCMIWDIFEGGPLFTGHDPEFKKYRSRAHLADMINLLGPPPTGLLREGKDSSRFFTEKYEFRAQDLLKNHVPLEERETTLEGQDKVEFLRLMWRMLQWEPEKRSSAKELAEDRWLYKHLH